MTESRRSLFERRAGVDPIRTPPRHGDVDDRAEEKEDGEFEQAALHGIIILRRIFSLPTAFGATGREVASQVVAAFDAEPVLGARASAY